MQYQLSPAELLTTNMSIVKKEVAAVGCSIIESDTKSLAAINAIISDNSKDCSDKQSNKELLELNVTGFMKTDQVVPFLHFEKCRFKILRQPWLSCATL